VKVLEKLREKRRTAYQTELDRRERVEMDEAGVQMYVARR
jgi:flagellar biosynthesis chaperone FliJ